MVKDITIGELIEKLSKFDSSKIVTVQYRDAGGEYMGEDIELYLLEKENRIIL